MKKLLLVFALSGAVQTAPVVSPSPVIALQKASPPASTSRWKPRGAKLLRSASAPAGEKGSLVSLLFYGRKSAAKKPFEVAEDALLVDLQIVSRQKIGKRWQTKLVRTIPMGFCEDWNWQETELFWLNPAKKSGPIVRIPRPEADELIAFPNGWNQKKAVRQIFGRFASSLAAISYKFDRVDDDGIFMVAEERSERTEGGSEESYKFMKWNGSGWKLEEDAASLDAH